MKAEEIDWQIMFLVGLEILPWLLLFGCIALTSAFYKNYSIRWWGLLGIILSFGLSIGTHRIIEKTNETADIAAKILAAYVFTFITIGWMAWIWEQILLWNGETPLVKGGRYGCF